MIIFQYIVWNWISLNYIDYVYNKNMISKIFFINKTKKDELHLYQEDYVIFILSSLVNRKNSSKEDMYKFLEEYYGSNVVKVSQFNHFVGKKFKSQNYLYTLKEKNEESLKYIEIREDIFFKFRNIPQSALYESFKEHFYCKNGVENSVLYFVYILYLNYDYDSKYMSFLVYNFYKNYEEKIVQFSNVIKKINAYYHTYELKRIFKNQMLIKLLSDCNLNNIEDLFNVPMFSIVLITYKNWSYFLDSLSYFSKDESEIFKELCSILENTLNEKEINVINNRYGLKDRKKKTLEQIGLTLNCTKEAVRQIETRSLKKLRESIFEYRNFLFYFFNKIKQENIPYVSEELFIKNINDETMHNVIMFFYNISDIEILYDSDYNVVYHKKVASIDKIVNENLLSMDRIVRKDQFKIMSYFEKKIIEHKYRKGKGSYYIKNGVYHEDLVKSVLDDVFWNGYRIGNDEDYNTFSNEYKRHYGDNVSVPSMRSIAGHIERIGYCLIDRGKHKNRNFCVFLPRDLTHSIIEFIERSEKPIYYRTIFYNFKEELLKLGVSNYYYLKGIIDYHIPKDFVKKRDIIYPNKKYSESFQYIVEYIKSFESVFTVEQVLDKFKGIMDYTLVSIFGREQKNGLLKLSNKRYIYYEKIGIDSDVILALQEYISKLFNEINEDFITIRKIYGRMKLKENKILDDLILAEDEYSFYSIIRYILKDYYGFANKIITKDKGVDVSYFYILENYISKLDYFNWEIIKSYCEKNNMRFPNSYLQFMEKQSDNFVQINKDLMVKKENLQISEHQMKEIFKSLEIYFNNYKELDLDNFRGYNYLPIIKYSWNKYLIVGLVNSYFNSYFEVNYTASNHRDTGYKIRRK